MNVLGYVFIMACLLQTQMNPGLYLEKYSMSVVLLLQFTAYNTETAYKTEKGLVIPWHATIEFYQLFTKYLLNYLLVITEQMKCRVLITLHIILLELVVRDNIRNFRVIGTRYIIQCG